MTFVPKFDNLKVSEGRGRGGRSVLSIIRDDNRFSTLVKILEKSRAVADLESSEEEFTLFAPTNQAFKKLQEHVAFQSVHDQDIAMEDVVRYHMIRGPIVYSQDLYQGQLLKTELKEKSLDGASQKIRVVKIAGNVRLNGWASISETDFEAENGVVHVLDNVLVPPQSVHEEIYKNPIQYSTFTAAMQQSNLQHDLIKDKAITCLIPNNQAWQDMNEDDISYLFSHAGKSDLKKIVEYHIVKDLVYARDIIQEGEIELNTFDHRERVRVEAIQRTEIHYHDEYKPNDWIISVNDGEAKIIGADLLARNGNVHEISSVLIPESVVLPSMVSGREGERRGDRRHDGRRNHYDEERRRRRGNPNRDGRRSVQ